MSQWVHTPAVWHWSATWGWRTLSPVLNINTSISRPILTIPCLKHALCNARCIRPRLEPPSRIYSLMHASVLSHHTHTQYQRWHWLYSRILLKRTQYLTIETVEHETVEVWVRFTFKLKRPKCLSNSPLSPIQCVQLLNKKKKLGYIKTKTIAVCVCVCKRAIYLASI